MGTHLDFVAAHEIALARQALADAHGELRARMMEADVILAECLALVARELGPEVCGVSVNPQRGDLERELDVAHRALRNATNAIDAPKIRVASVEAIR